MGYSECWLNDLVPFSKVDARGLGDCSPPIPRRKTTNAKRERCQDVILSDISSRRMYVSSHFRGVQFNNKGVWLKFLDCTYMCDFSAYVAPSPFNNPVSTPGFDVKVLSLPSYFHICSCFMMLLCASLSWHIFFLDCLHRGVY